MSVGRCFAGVGLRRPRWLITSPGQNHLRLGKLEKKFLFKETMLSEEASSTLCPHGQRETQGTGGAMPLLQKTVQAARTSAEA